MWHTYIIYVDLSVGKAAEIKSLDVLQHAIVNTHKGLGVEEHRTFVVE